MMRSARSRGSRRSRSCRRPDSTSAAPTSSRTLDELQDAGGSTCCRSSASRAPSRGVCSLGLNTTVLPGDERRREDRERHPDREVPGGDRRDDARAARARCARPGCSERAANPAQRPPRLPPTSSATDRARSPSPRPRRSGASCPSPRLMRSPISSASAAEQLRRSAQPRRRARRSAPRPGVRGEPRATRPRLDCRLAKGTSARRRRSPAMSGTWRSRIGMQIRGARPVARPRGVLPAIIAASPSASR